MDDPKKRARRAGWLYLLGCLPAPFASLYVPDFPSTARCRRFESPPPS